MLRTIFSHGLKDILSDSEYGSRTMYVGLTQNKHCSVMKEHVYQCNDVAHLSVFNIFLNNNSTSQHRGIVQ